LAHVRRTSSAASGDLTSIWREISRQHVPQPVLPGKRRSGKTRNGSKWLDMALEEAAMAAIRTKDVR
jgi:hypothetical protein